MVAPSNPAGNPQLPGIPTQLDGFGLRTKKSWCPPVRVPGLPIHVAGRHLCGSSDSQTPATPPTSERLHWRWAHTRSGRRAGVSRGAGVASPCRAKQRSSAARAQRPAGAPRLQPGPEFRRYRIPWTLGKIPRLGRTFSLTSTGPLLVAILSATERLRIAPCVISRPSPAGCSPGVAASLTSRPSSGSIAAAGARRCFRSGRRSSHWSVWRFCARSFSSGPARSDQPELLAVARLAAPVRYTAP
jgi:hypothetical protein